MASGVDTANSINGNVCVNGARRAGYFGRIRRDLVCGPPERRKGGRRRGTCSIPRSVSQPHAKWKAEIWGAVEKCIVALIGGRWQGHEASVGGR